MKVAVLASGSQGNAILVRSGKHAVLFDLGISTRKLRIRLSELGEDISGLEAIFISHEHRDHIAGLEVFCKKFETPIYATSGTLGSPLMRGLNNLVSIKAGDVIKINGFEVQAFRIPHDAAEPVGFIIHDHEHKMALATDLGSSNTLVQERLKGADLVVLESNHDPEMLKQGPYPWPLKQRILGKNGHLCNQDCARLLTKIQKHGMRKVVLAHLSEKNNRPDLAFKASREIVDEGIDIWVTSQKQPGPVVDL